MQSSLSSASSTQHMWELFEFGVCVPFASIYLLKIVNQTDLLHKKFEIPTLCSQFYEILKFVFLSEVEHKSFCVKFLLVLLANLKSSKNHIKMREYSTYRLIFGFFLKVKKLLCANEAFRIILLQRHKKFRCVIIFLSGMQ